MSHRKNKNFYAKTKIKLSQSPSHCDVRGVQPPIPSYFRGTQTRPSVRPIVWVKTSDTEQILMHLRDRNLQKLWLTDRLRGIW
jgi:hypothetical protein